MPDECGVPDEHASRFRIRSLLRVANKKAEVIAFLIECFESFGCDFETASEIVTVGVATGREQGLYRANAEAQAKAAAEATDEHDPRAAEDKS